MQYSIVAVLALAGAAFANPAPADVTITTSTTTVVTITSCEPTVTECPARLETHTNALYITYPAGAHAAATGGALYGTAGYHAPSLTGYHGPAYTGAASQVKVAGALAGVGAVAALIL